MRDRVFCVLAIRFRFVGVEYPSVEPDRILHLWTSVLDRMRGVDDRDEEVGRGVERFDGTLRLSCDDRDGVWRRLHSGRRHGSLQSGTRPEGRGGCERIFRRRVG